MFCWKNNLKRTPPACLIVLAVFFAGCESGKETSSLYSIDSLVSAQVIALAEAKAILHKEATLGNRTDRSVYTPGDTTAWTNELDIFRHLQQINKPVNRDSYIVDDGLYDPGSNLMVKAFTSTRQLPVMSMRIYYDNAIKKPRKIEALYEEENSLYKSSKLLRMEFQQVNNKTVLTSYTIHGGQKMVLGDSVTFSVKGKIQID
jgi:hypothetical protein